MLEPRFLSSLYSLSQVTHHLPLRLFFFPFLNWRLITLKYYSDFCHTLTSVSHGCTCVPDPEPCSHLPPHPILLGHPSAPALSTLSHASNLDWWSVSHMIMYMFQCYSHPTLAFSHRVEKSSLSLLPLPPSAILD